MNHLIKCKVAILISVTIEFGFMVANCFADNTEQSFSYSPELRKRHSSGTCYAYFAERDYFMSTNYYHGQTNRLVEVTETINKIEKELDSLSIAEKTALSNIWKKAEETRVMEKLYFASSSQSGSATRVVTDLSPLSISHMCPADTNQADVIIDDVCALTNLTWLSLVYTKLHPDSFKKLTRLQNLEYFYPPYNITDELLAMLLREMPSLKYVGLSDCELISGAFAQNKKDGENLCEISFMGDTRIDPKYLVDLIALPNLRYVYMDGVEMFLKSSYFARERLIRAIGVRH